MGESVDPTEPQFTAGIFSYLDLKVSLFDYNAFFYAWMKAHIYCIAICSLFTDFIHGGGSQTFFYGPGWQACLAGPGWYL